MCARTLCKVFLIGFNIVFFILGAVVLGVGIWVKFDNESVTEALDEINKEGEDFADSVDIPSLLSSAAYVLMVVGGFMFLVGFLGCCGAWKEWRLFLGLYALVVLVILIIEIAAVVVAVIYKDEVEDELEDFLTDTVEDGYEDGVRYDSNGELTLSDDALTMAWDVAQFELECCGSANYTDYRNAKDWNNVYTFYNNGQVRNITAKVPISCCRVKDNDLFPDKVEQLEFLNLEACLTNPMPANANVEGCYDAFKDLIEKYGTVTMAVALGVSFFELIGVIMACYLCRLVGKDGDVKA